MAVLVCFVAPAHGQSGPVGGAVASSTELTLLSFNVMANDLNLRVDGLAAWIAALKPDVACLQEMHTAANFNRMNQRLSALGWPMDSRQALEYMGVFSRWPIRDYQTFPDGYDRRIQTFVIDHPVAGPLRFFQIHPYPGYACVVVPELLKAAARFSEPRFLLGDFNLEPAGGCFPSLLVDHTRACTEESDVRCANTVNRPVWCQYNPSYCTGGQTFPDAAIDHILYQPTNYVRLVEAYADHDMKSSDHFPVVARFALTPFPKATVHIK